MDPLELWRESWVNTFRIKIASDVWLSNAQWIHWRKFVRSLSVGDGAVSAVDVCLGQKATTAPPLCRSRLAREHGRRLCHLVASYVDDTSNLSIIRFLVG